MEYIDSLKITNQILKKYNIRAEKKYGQNFLINDNILKEIIDISNINKDDLVIEIGPGLGNLTHYILNTAKYALLIEIDEKCLNILNDRFSKNENYTLLNEDILNINIDEIISNLEVHNKETYNNVKVVANLPYYITTPIIFKLLQNSNKITDITIMVQKEVAERMVANTRTKDYGILTLMVKYFAKTTIELIVPNSSFIPEPNVTSAVVHLKKEKLYNTKNEQLLFELIHKSFAQRRKKMVNSLVSNKFNNMNKEQIELLLQKCNLSLNVRAEELELEDYINIISNIDNI